MNADEQRPRPARHDVTVTRGWLADGTRLLTDAVAELPDAGFAEPSLLPGWSRAHVVAHVARNAEALVRLATWARTGEVTPMYASVEAREAEVEQAATEPPPELRHLLAATAAELDQALDALDDQAWDATVETLSGRRFRARLLPWLRVRETWLHAVDLGTGTRLDVAPAELVDELAADVTATLAAADGCPAVVLAPADRGSTWRLGPESPESPESPDSPASPLPTVRGTAADLVLWLTGRDDGSRLDADLPLPTLPRWL